MLSYSRLNASHMLLSIAIRSGCPMELSDVAHRAMLQTRAKRIHNTNLKGNTEFRIVKYCINAQGGPPPPIAIMLLFT